jgi:hypothetical protein
MDLGGIEDGLGIGLAETWHGARGNRQPRCVFVVACRQCCAIVNRSRGMLPGTQSRAYQAWVLIAGFLGEACPGSQYY